MWKHKSKFKGKFFLGNKEESKCVQVFNLKNVVDGRETKSYRSWQAAVKDGWIKLGK